MNGTIELIIGVVVLAILGLVVYRSVRGPKAPPVNPFDAVTPSRAPNFPDQVNQSAAVGGDTPAAEAGLKPVEEEATEPEEEMTIAAYVAQAEEQEKDADFDQAIDSISEAIALAQVEFGGDSVEVAQLLVKQGQLFQLRDYQESADEIDCSEYLQAFAILEQRYGPNSEELQPVLRLLISWYYQTGDQQKAEALIRRSENIEEAASYQTPAAADQAGVASPGPAVFSVKVSPFAVAFNSNDAASVDSCKEGDEAFAAAEYDDSVAAFEAALESVQSEVGRAAPELVPLFRRLGRVLQVRDADERDDEGEAYTGAADNYQIALGMLVQAQGFNAIELAPLLLDLASFEDQRGEHYKAEGYLRRLDMILRLDRAKRN